ncbi:MAG: hypothetical protein ACR2N2_04510 [Acidimicrobiia bacterium]
MTTVLDGGSATTGKVSGWWLVGLLRIAFGWTWLWAFFDKMFGLGFGTCSSTNDAGEKVVEVMCDAAFVNGGSPTYGILTFATEDSATGGLFSWMASSAPDVQNWADWLFMIGLLLIGLPFILGIGVRLSGLGGVIMYTFMYLAIAVLPANNPLIDDHILGALTMALLVFLNAGVYMGLGKWWQDLDIVQKYPILR